MGSTAQDLTKKGKGSHRKSNGSGKPHRWLNVDSNLIRLAIQSSTDDGGALLFGITSDKGALVIRVYGETEQPYSEYFGPHEDLEGWLDDFCKSHGYIPGEEV